MPTTEDKPPTSSIPPHNPNYNPHVPPQQEFEEYEVDCSGEGLQNEQRNSSRPSCTKREVGGAAVAAGIAGLAVSGPILGLAAGGTAAYVATTQSNSVGSATRNAGEAMATVGDGARDLDRKHNITDKSKQMAKSAAQRAKELDEKHKIVNKSKKLASSTAQKAKELDEKHHIVDRSKGAARQAAISAKNFNEKHHVIDKSKDAARKAASSAKEFNEKHHVAEKAKGAAVVTSKKMMEGIKFVSKKMNKNKNNNEPVDIL